MNPAPTPLFGRRHAVVAMIHLQALPGTPGNRLAVGEIIAQACREAEIYAEAGVDALLLENMHDRPYLCGRVGPEIVAAMTAAACAIRRLCALSCGLQVLAGANEEALAIAHAAGFDFIRAEGFVFAHVADEGWMESCAAKLLRARKAWGAGAVQIFTDIKKKHSSHAVTADVSLAETARAAEFFCSDGLILSGTATGEPVDLSELEQTAKVTRLPILIGSGANLGNVEQLFQHASAVIVGSHFKAGGHWTGPVDAGRVGEFMQRVRTLR